MQANLQNNICARINSTNSGRVYSSEHNFESYNTELSDNSIDQGIKIMKSYDRIHVFCIKAMALSKCAYCFGFGHCFIEIIYTSLYRITI